MKSQMKNIFGKFLKKQTQILSTDSRGFTLMEMLIVIALIGMIGAFVATNVMGRFNKAKVQTTRIGMRQLGTILEDFRRECGFYPTTPDQGLQALISKPTSGRECKNYDPKGYIENKAILQDSWGNDYFYESNGSSYMLKSFGNDGKEGGDGLDKDLSSNDQ